MPEILFSIPLMVIYAFAYGITMKVADLLNEHGLKWFRGSAVIFGVLWGMFGAMLVMGNNTIANIILAMNIAFIIRNRLDYINHQIASSIIIISFLFTSVFSPILFLIFYFVFLIFGSMKDYVDDILKKKMACSFSLMKQCFIIPFQLLFIVYFMEIGLYFGVFFFTQSHMI